MAQAVHSRTRRPHYAMPGFVRAALTKKPPHGEVPRAPALPAQRYLWWITSAKREETKQKRLDQMLAELAAGDAYMKMPYRPG